VQAAAIPGLRSPEFWKPLKRSDLFAGCDVLWREDDTTLCRIPGASGSFAHVVPRAALVRREPKDWHDVSEVSRFDEALDMAVHADWQWNGADNATIRTTLAAGNAITIQVSHHPGWHAMANGKSVPILRDGLGLMWLDSPCAGPCEIQLAYNGGWELLLCRWISVVTLLTISVWTYRTFRRVTVRLPHES
jgi:hypothetical protein